ncbi:unnamed protein product [Lymnaea stagnalis]|uniref:Sushi domain-containing protein n=1 Tax=Lymnaea stagnalis TaxID=6523 RepID=A0AAV2HCQ6_LYMST
MTAKPPVSLCPVLATNQNNFVTIDNMASLSLSTYERGNGTVVNISCWSPDTHTLKGSSQVACRNGVWVPDPPICEKKTVYCPELATDQQGLITQDNVASLYPSSFERNDGTVVNVKCYTPSFTLKGSSQLTCTNGKWLPEVPVCVSGDSVVPYTPSDDWDNANIIYITIASICAAIFLTCIAVLIFKYRCLKTKQGSPSLVSSTPPCTPSSVGTRVIQSKWLEENRSWTYLSVDKLLRDMETSRRDNPNHSWRDFIFVSKRNAPLN